jgi:hypothetical protein
MAIVAATFKMVPVETESFTAVGYTHASRLLYITFRDGSTLAYQNVPGFRFEGLLAAPRKEAYFRTFIKNAFLSKAAQPPEQT